MSVDLEEVRKYLLKATMSYRNHSDYEDGFQEGMIRAWKDVQDGNENTLHVCRRAKQWAVNYITDLGSGRRRATGAPVRAHDGLVRAQGDLTREKISQYIDEYMALHETTPTNKQISMATGISSSVVSRQRLNIKTGRGTNFSITTEQYGELRTDWSAYKHSAITDDNRDFVESYKATTFETDLVDELTFYELLAPLSVEHQKALYLYHILGYTGLEIAKHLGLSEHQMTGRRKVNDAHKALKNILDPQIETCHNGVHIRTEENTKLTLRSDGYTVKSCLACKTFKKQRDKALSENNKTRTTKPKIVKTSCKSEHEIRGYKSGRRYCKICNNLRQYPGKTVDQIPAASKLWTWDEGARP